MDTSHSTTSSKRCSKCKEWFPRTSAHWYRNKAAKDGWQYNCKLCCNASTLKWRSENVDHVIEVDHKYKADHKERIHAREKGYREKHHSNILAATRRWRLNNPDKQDWYYRNKDRAKANAQRRRAREVNAEGSHTKTDIERQYKAQAGNCWWCGKPLNGKYHVDHRIPLDKGGSNDAGNIVLAHARCNLSKGAKLPGEWIGRLL